MSTSSAIRLVCLQPRPMAGVRLLCIPFAGGGAAAFRPWAKLLPAHVEAFVVQLPGREERLREPPLVRWPAMMEALRAAVSPLPPLATAIFGHSLGAVIGLELARWMHAAQPGRLAHFFPAGRPWPGRPTGERGDLDALGDDELLEALDRRYGSLSSSLAHPDIRELALPALRADLKLLDSHVPAAPAPLACPVTVFGGERDPGTDRESLEGWRHETSGPFRLHMLDGEHFFLESHREALVAEIAAALGGSRGR